MQAIEVQRGDVLTTHSGTWIVREVRRANDDLTVQLRISAGRTDPGHWYAYDPDTDLNIYRAVDR